MPRDSKKIFPINLLLPDLFETISSSPSQRSKKLFFTRVCDLDNEKWLVPILSVSPPFEPRIWRGPK